MRRHPSRLPSPLAAALLALTACATVSGSAPDAPPAGGGAQAPASSPAPAAAGAPPSAPVPGATPDAPPITSTPAWRRQARPVVIRHATVMPASGPAIADGAVAFADGKLVAVGKNADVATPAGAEEVDGTGLFVTPGIIDAHSHLGVYASPGTFSTADGNEATGPVTAEVNAEHAYWPQDPGLRRAAAGGVTAQLVLPGSANLIGGRGFPAKLHFGRSAREVRFPGAPDSLKMACGENPRRVYGGRGAPPQTRMGNVAGYRQAFAQARAYLDKQDEEAKKRAKDGEKAGPASERNLRLETLAEVLRGRILVQNHCYRADEMAVMLQVAREFGFTIRTFHHATEAYKVADLLAQAGTGAAVWADWWGFKMEAWDGIPENAALVHKAGARAVLHSDSPHGIQRLNQEAAKAAARAREEGIVLSEEEVLRWVTLNPAWAMGVEAQTGSLEPGKMADVVLWRNHPFSAYARAERVWADGIVTYDVRTGAQEPSDFEVGVADAVQAALSARPAPRPQGLPAPCDPAKEGCQALALDDKAACTLFRGVTVASEGRLTPDSHVLVQGGRVAAVSAAALPPPAGCRVVEGGGKLLAPGLIDPLTQLGLVEVGAEEQSNDTSPRGEAAKEPVHAALRAADSFNPASVTLDVVRSGGITSAGAVPAGGLVPGQSAWVTVDGKVRRAPLAMNVNINNAGREALSSTRAAVLERLRELLTDAREFGRRRADFEGNRMRELAASRADLEALQPVLAGRVPVVVAADRASDIRAALALGREFSLRLVVAGASEAWQVAGELAQARVPVILQATQNLPASFDSIGSRADAAALLEKAGVRVLLSTLAEPYLVRTLPQEAGNAVAWGLSWEAAFRAVTSNAADALGLEGVGRVAPGALADLVLWSGDPLELGSRPLGMWVDGRQVSLESRQDALYEKYKTLPGAAQRQ